MGCKKTQSNLRYYSSSKADVVTYALSLQCAPYRYGKSSPEERFDCSGFVKQVYEKHGIRLPRSTKEMASTLPIVAKDDVHSGDFVFFDTKGWAYFHVGIYLD